MRYLTVEIHWWALWYDLAVLRCEFLEELGLKCKHPKDASVDYGRSCGACGALRYL